MQRFFKLHWNALAIVIVLLTHSLFLTQSHLYSCCLHLLTDKTHTSCTYIYACTDGANKKYIHTYVMHVTATPSHTAPQRHIHAYMHRERDALSSHVQIWFCLHGSRSRRHLHPSRSRGHVQTKVATAAVPKFYMK